MHFGFTRTESRGVLVLLWILALFVIGLQFYKYHYSQYSEMTIKENDVKILEEILTSLNTNEIHHNGNILKPTSNSLASTVSFDINTANQSQLKDIRGIGDVLSTRILKFRDKLGGFISKSQYEEVYGLSPTAISDLKNNTYIKSNFEPKKININSEINILGQHPYIGYKLAKAIVNYRKQHGEIKTIQELKKLNCINDGMYAKMHPYLCL